MDWTRSTATSMVSGDWTVSKSSVKGIPVYVLWRADLPFSLGRFDTFKAAADHAEELQAQRGK